MAEKATTSSAVSLSLPSGPAAKTAPDREGHLAQLRPPQLTSPTLAAPPSSNLAAIPHLVAPHGRESLPPRAGGHWDQPPLPRRPGDHPLGPCPLPLSRRLVHNPGPPPTLLGLIPSLPLATAPSEVSSRKAGLALRPLKPLPSRRFGHPSPHPACQVLGASCAPGRGGRLARTRRASRDKRRRCKVTGRAVPARCPLGVEQPALHTGSGWEETPRRPGRGDSPQSDLQTQRPPTPPRQEGRLLRVTGARTGVTQGFLVPSRTPGTSAEPKWRRHVASRTVPGPSGSGSARERPARQEREAELPGDDRGPCLRRPPNASGQQ